MSNQRKRGYNTIISICCIKKDARSGDFSQALEDKEVDSTTGQADPAMQGHTHSAPSEASILHESRDGDMAIDMEGSTATARAVRSRPYRRRRDWERTKTSRTDEDIKYLGHLHAFVLSVLMVLSNAGFDLLLKIGRRLRAHDARFGDDTSNRQDFTGCDVFAICGQDAISMTHLGCHSVTTWLVVITGREIWIIWPK